MLIKVWALSATDAFVYFLYYRVQSTEELPEVLKSEDGQRKAVFVSPTSLKNITDLFCT